MDSNNVPTIEVSVTCHKITEEEIKQSKLEEKQRKKERRRSQKVKRAEARKLKRNFVTMNSCMIHPDNIKIGCLTECIHSKHIIDFAFMGTALGHREEEIEPIEGTKTLIQIEPEFELYIDLDEINSNRDLADVRRRISSDGISIGGKILDCSIGKIRVDRKTLRGHPYFENTTSKEPISIKQLKRLIGNNTN